MYPIGKGIIVGKTQVLIVDDNKMVRDGLKTLLELESDFSVVGDAENGLQAVEYARALQPDVVIMDLSMPGMDGVAAAKAIKRHKPEVVIAILSVYQADDYLGEDNIVEIASWIPKSSAPEEIINALRASIIACDENGSL